MIAPTAQQTTVPGVPTPAATPPQGIQQVMPGQAGSMAMNQMLMQQQAPAGGAGVGSFVKPLSTLDPVSLQQELLSPVSQYPKFAVLAALDSKNKQLKAQQAMQQQLAMQQAQTQGQGTVADQIVAESGQLQGAYAHGGEVRHFQLGGGTWVDQLPEDSILRVVKDWINAGRPAMQKPLIDSLVEKLSPESKAAMQADTGTEDGSYAKAEAARFASSPAAPPMPPSPAPRPDTGAGAGPRLKGAPTPAAPRTDMFADPRNAILANQGYTNAQIAHMRSSAEPTPEIIESRKGLAALRQRQFEESQKETADVRAEAERRLQEAKARPGIFSDPEALASLAASISTRKGELMGSAAKGLAGVQGERRKALEAAQEKYGMSQEKIRTMNALNRQMELAMVEKAHAEKVGDWQGVQKANADIAALLAANAKFAATTGLGIAGLQVQEQQARTAAANAARRSPLEQAYAHLTGPGKMDPVTALRSVYGATAEPKTESAAEQQALKIAADPMAYNSLSPSAKAYVDSVVQSMSIKRLPVPDDFIKYLK